MNNFFRFILVVIVLLQFMSCLLKADESKLERLINRLAISNEVASNKQPLLNNKKDDISKKIEEVYEVANEIAQYEKEAFPYLLRYLNDKRQSAPFRSVIPHDVGDACYCIIRRLIYKLPVDYPRSFYRKGEDGKSKERQYFLKEDLFNKLTVADWLSKRKNNSLKEIQLEALEWLVEEEYKIGFAQEKDKEVYLYPLLREVENLRMELYSKKNNK